MNTYFHYPVPHSMCVSKGINLIPNLFDDNNTQKTESPKQSNS